MDALHDKSWNIVGGTGGDGGYTFIAHGCVSSCPLPLAFDWVRMGHRTASLPNSNQGVCLISCFHGWRAPRVHVSTLLLNLEIFRFNLIQKNSWKIFVISYVCTCHLTISVTTMMNLFYETHTNKTLTQTLNNQFSYSWEISLRIPSSPLFWW
jgi:hypothetical protein